MYNLVQIHSFSLIRLQSIRRSEISLLEFNTAWLFRSSASMVWVIFSKAYQFLFGYFIKKFDSFLIGSLIIITIFFTLKSLWFYLSIIICLHTFRWFGLVCWVLWLINLCMLLNARFIFYGNNLFYLKQFSLAWVHSLIVKNISISNYSSSYM